MNNQNTSYTFGQLGSAYLGTASVNFDPPTGQVIVSILSLDNATEFHTLTPDNDTSNTAFAGSTVTTENGTNADTWPVTETLDAGISIFGRWSRVQLDAGAVILYFGY